jgi:hypothetical protein
MEGLEGNFLNISRVVSLIKGGGVMVCDLEGEGQLQSTASIWRTGYGWFLGGFYIIWFCFNYLRVIC